MLPPASGALSLLLFAAQMVTAASVIDHNYSHQLMPSLPSMFSNASGIPFGGTNTTTALQRQQKQQQMLLLGQHLAKAISLLKMQQQTENEQMTTATTMAMPTLVNHRPHAGISVSAKSQRQRRLLEGPRPPPALVAAEHPFIVFARNIYSWLVPCMAAILLMAVLGNGLIVLSAPWLSGEASHYNWLCVSLAGADAWAASLLIAGLILNSYVPVVLKIAWDGKCVAALLEIFRIAGMLTSNLHILALAANQFLGICHPLLYKTTISTEGVRWLILLLWLIPIGFVGAWFVSIPGDSLFSPGGCRYEFYTQLPFRLYIFVAFAAILLLTVLIYAHILMYLLRQKARYRLRRNSVLYSYRRRVQSKMKLLTTTLLILSTFTLSWGVCVLYFVLVCKRGCPFIYLESISFQTGLLLNSSVNFLVALKLVMNPLIYALRMCHIRKSVATFFGAAMRSRSLSTQLLTLRPMSRQLSSPRPFTRAEGDQASSSHNHHHQQQQQKRPNSAKGNNIGAAAFKGQQSPQRTQSLSDPPSRSGCDGSGSSRELLTTPTGGDMADSGNGTATSSMLLGKSSQKRLHSPYRPQQKNGLSVVKRSRSTLADFLLMCSGAAGDGQATLSRGELAPGLAGLAVL